VRVGVLRDLVLVATENIFVQEGSEEAFYRWLTLRSPDLKGGIVYYLWCCRLIYSLVTGIELVSMALFRSFHGRPRGPFPASQMKRIGTERSRSNL
jgi:hypothetical protein